MITLIALKGTEKQVAYAEAIKSRLLVKLDSAITAINEVIVQEKELGSTDKEITDYLAGITIGDLQFKIAFSLANKENPIINPEVYVKILQLAKNTLMKWDDAKTIIDLCTPETLTVFVSHTIKKITFK